MFNLEQSILEWRRQMLAAGVKNPNILDELESHLREDVAHQMQSGASPEQAFQAAVQRVGPAGLLQREFAKLGGKKWALLRQLKDIFVGSFAPFPSWSALTPGARRTLELARAEAPRLHHNFVGTEHVLLGLLALENGIVPNVLKRMGVDREDLRKQVENWVGIFPSEKMLARLPYTPRVRKSLRLTNPAKSTKSKFAANAAKSCATSSICGPIAHATPRRGRIPTTRKNGRRG
jgi:hypothetical protein